MIEVAAASYQQSPHGPAAAAGCAHETGGRSATVEGLTAALALGVIGRLKLRCWHAMDRCSQLRLADLVHHHRRHHPNLVLVLMQERH